MKRLSTSWWVLHIFIGTYACIFAAAWWVVSTPTKYLKRQVRQYFSRRRDSKIVLDKLLYS